MIANLHGPLMSRTSNATVAEVRQFGPECRVPIQSTVVFRPSVRSHITDEGKVHP
jgi:hypothetical protein